MTKVMLFSEMSVEFIAVVKTIVTVVTCKTQASSAT